MAMRPQPKTNNKSYASLLANTRNEQSKARNGISPVKKPDPDSNIKRLVNNQKNKRFAD